MVKRLRPSSDLVKPEIRAGSYAIDFGDRDGIPKKEVPQLRIFLRDVAPFLKPAIQAAELFERRLESEKHLKRPYSGEAFSPLIQLTKMFGDRDVQYHLRFTWDGEIFLDREEGVMVPSLDGRGWNTSGVSVTEEVANIVIVGSEEG
jgi:hypothetical protein